MTYNYQLIQIGEKFALRRPAFFGGWKYLIKYAPTKGSDWSPDGVIFYDFKKDLKSAWMMDKEEADKQFNHYSNFRLTEANGIKVIKESNPKLIGSYIPPNNALPPPKPVFPEGRVVKETEL